MTDLLFPNYRALPDGFRYYEDFITIDEETQLLNLISKIELRTFHFQGYEAKRKVANFGYDWSFEKRILTKGVEIPEEYGSLVRKVAGRLEIDDREFAELLITEYPVGAVINWHRDAPPFELICGISLLSDCVFRFRPQDKTKRDRKLIFSVPLKRRSLYSMQGAARREWQHSIPAQKQVRYSITLRTLKEKK